VRSIYFTGMTVRAARERRCSYNADQFRVDVYNLRRGAERFPPRCDEDEIWFQFRGHSLNHTEWGAMELDAAKCPISRAAWPPHHRQSRFLRMVLYSRKLVHPKAFNNVSERATRFDVQ
jgi:hypothetical protein